MVLSKGDDFPLHQTPEPVAYAGTDRNFYDRYFFNGYGPDGTDFFAVAFGVYPHLDIADAHLCVIRGGVQHCLHASREMGMERMALEVGPVRIEVLEPLQSLRVTLDDAEGMAAEITFAGRAFPIEEPRFIHRIGPRSFMDYTRMTQNGRFEGWISVDGDRRALADATLGTRDRSWGVRPVGARDAQAIPGSPLPAFFWQWTPINLPSGSLFYHLNAQSDGEAWNTRAAWVPEGGDASAITEGRGQLETQLEPGSRWPASGTLKLDLDGAPEQVKLTSVGRFQMRGLGYTSPQWGHGLHHGALKVAREDITLDQLAPLQADNLHVQAICTADADYGAGNGEKGLGVFEQLILGPYAPFGLREMFDGG